MDLQNECLFQEHELRRIASLIVHGFEPERIAIALGLRPEELEEIMKFPEFQKAMQEKHQEILDREEATIDTWDQVELQAITKIGKALEWNSNPDFLLKVAAVANKAVRQKGPSEKNVPLEAGQTLPTVVIQLNTSYTERMNGTLTLETPEAKAAKKIEKKQVDMPTPRIVSEVLLRDQPDKSSHQERMMSMMLDATKRQQQKVVDVEIEEMFESA